jgi:hypothetical protein
VGLQIVNIADPYWLRSATERQTAPRFATDAALKIAWKGQVFD